jgi:hypothetical protein
MMTISRWATWVVLGSIAAGASCALDERAVSLRGLGDRDAGPGSIGELGARLEVTPPSVDLGWVTTGFAARSRVSLRNSGDAPLPAPAVDWSPGSNPDFVVVQNLCEGAVAPGQSCEIRLQVVPSLDGALQGTLRVQGAGASAEVGVAAVGKLAGDLILAPAAGSFEDFGGVLIGAVSEGTFSLSNPGAANTGAIQLRVNRPEFAFAVPGPGECSDGVTDLGPGQSCNVRLVFSPSARGPLEATVTVATEAAGSMSLTVAGRGLTPGLLEASATGIDFDGVLLTQSSRRSIKLTNGGDQPLELQDTVLSPAGVEGFTIANSDCAAGTLLMGGGSCSVEVEFRPLAVDLEMAAELVASYVGAALPLVVPLRGIGLLPGSLELSAVTAGKENFGDVLVGESVEQVFQIQNPSAQPSGAISWATSGAFEVVTPPDPGECLPGVTSLVDGESCALRVRFAPTLREVSNGTFTINSSLAGATGLTLLGRGVIAGQVRADTEVNFGRVLTAASADRTLTLSNVGDQPLAPPTLALSGADPAQVAAFAFEPACSVPLALGEECSVTLRFAPTVAVPHAATLQLSSPGSEPTSVLLLGEALVPGSLVIIPAVGGSADFGDVAIGTSSTRSFTITNPGAVPSGPLTIATDNNQFAVALGDCATADLVDGSSCTFDVSLAPTDSLSAAANVSVQSPGGGRAGIAVTGRGRQKAALSATGNRDLGRANIGQAALTAPENEFTWTVNNTGDLATGALALANDNPTEFGVTADTCTGLTIAGKASCAMTIRFRPAVAGPRTGRITVSDPVGLLSAPLVLTGLGVQLVGPGESCVNADCQTGECTRAGVCCDTACDRVCEVCSATGICTAQTTRQACGNGAACFGVDQCKLQEGAACTAVGGAQQCGSGFCERRLGGAGDGDRICCLEGCAAGLACNAQGRCEQPTAGDGAVCGRPGDLPCGANLVCKQCVGSGSGQSQCKPAAACCGTCGAGLECVNGSSCGCPVGVNGQRGIPCADGCITNQAGACCPEAPGCDPGDLCDPFDNLCKECLSNADCRNARQGSVPTCNQGTCSYPCNGATRECNGQCITGCCFPTDCPNGQQCNGGQCQSPATLVSTPPFLQFGTIPLGDGQASQTVTISNTGSQTSGPLTVTVDQVGAIFGFTSTCQQPLVFNGTCQVTISGFTGTRAGDIEASVSVAFGGASPLRIPLRATGEANAPELVQDLPLGFTSFDLGEITENTDSFITWVFRNSGTAITGPIQVVGTNTTEFRTTAQFPDTGPPSCPPLSPGDTCAVEIHFRVEVGPGDVGLQPGDRVPLQSTYTVAGFDTPRFTVFATLRPPFSVDDQ